MKSATIDSAAPIGAIARLKLARELGDNKKQMDTVGDGPMAAMKRLKLSKRSNEIRAQLGAGARAPDDVSVISPQLGVENPAIIKLREVSEGKHDGEGLDEMYAIIREAAYGLDEAGLLVDDAEAVANAAITHWAEMEERING